MKLFLSLLFFLNSFTNAPIGEIRRLYPTATSSEAASRAFAQKLSEVTEQTPDAVLVAYKGASIIMLSRFEKKISDKIKVLKEGASLIEKAVAKDSKDAEIRLIRLSIQENLPAIVSYKKNIQEDKNFILKNFDNQSLSLKEYFKGFIFQSKSFSKDEKQSLK